VPAIQSDVQCAACDLERSLLIERVKSSVLGATSRVCVRHFQLSHCLGRGSSGVVFAALDLRSAERVALKHFHSSTSARDVRREFRTIAHVRYPNLVQLYELFSHSQSWFLTMELIDGSTILSHLRSNAPPSARYGEGTLRGAFAQLCGAVHALHALGQVHLDLKPSNVLVEGERVVVLDYGLTRPFPRASSASSSLLGGTPAYMAPEQRGSRRALPASDMYAIGLMLFEALTGSLPACDESGVTRMAMRPSQMALQVPRDLDDLCSLLLQHDPGARPGAEAVRRALSGRSISDVEAASVQEPAASPFVGRASQLVALQREYAHMCEGTFRVAIIEGESGMGKTALLEQFLGQLRQASTAVLLQGRCHAREHIPFNMFDEVVELLMRYLAGLTEREQLRLLPRHVRPLRPAQPGSPGGRRALRGCLTRADDAVADLCALRAPLGRGLLCRAARACGRHCRSPGGLRPQVTSAAEPPVSR
jgi:hypothetical protein